MSKTLWRVDVVTESFVIVFKTSFLCFVSIIGHMYWTTSVIALRCCNIL